MKTFSAFLLLILLSFIPAHAQGPAIPQSQAEIKLSFAPLVKKAAPSVVNIYTKKVVQERVNPFFNDPLFQQFFGRQFGGGGGFLRNRVQSSLGSGVIVQSDGHVITNAHVVRGAEEITVILHDGREFEAKRLLQDDRTDLAVLKIEGKGETFSALEAGDSDALEVGDLVLAIGNPFGVGQTVTSGIVSAVARTAVGISDFNFFIQTDAAINPGNSGGALINMAGQLVGINSAIFSKDGGSLGIGFAIPVSMAKAVLKASASGGRVTRPWSGVVMQRITPDMIEGLGLSTPHGALVKSLHPSSPAGQAGLKPGDVVLSIDGKEVNDPEALRFRMAMKEIGTPVDLKLFRKGQARDITFNAIAPPEDPPRNETEIKGRNPLSGATVANLSPAVVDELGDAAPVDEGVVVLNAKGVTAARLGLQKGDVIVSINGKKIKAVKDLKSILADERVTRWNLQIQRGEQVVNVTVTG